MPEHVSKTYNIHYLRMSDAGWIALAQAYKELPGFMGYHEGIPYWFGVEQDSQETGTSYLWASIEPSGLMVDGQLESEDWARWQQAFLPLATTAVGFAVKPTEDDKEWPYTDSI